MIDTNIFLPRKHNVLFVTIDSCRFDTAEHAQTPFLTSISPLRRCETTATYTLPAHLSFFIGILPVLTDGNPEYLPSIKQIWRSAKAKQSDKSVAVPYSSKNIIEHYVNHGYHVVGAGGVSFFREQNMLPSFFPKFFHFCKPDSIPSHLNVPRTEAQFPLAHIDTFTKEFSNDPFFLFVNCPETHVPFDCPATRVDNFYKGAVEKIYRVDSIKHRRLSDEEGLSQEEREVLKSSQINSLEWIDARLAILYQKIKNALPTLVVVMSDHGEEFGEHGRYGHVHADIDVMTVPLWCGTLNN